MQLPAVEEQVAVAARKVEMDMVEDLGRALALP
jgi:hypothetical protein